MITPEICTQTQAQVVLVTDIRPPDTRRPRAAQTRDVFLKMEAALHQQAMTFADVVRTWFHLDDILAWYGDFNAQRSAFFVERGVFRGIVPASTGVGIPNQHGAALIGSVLAIKQLAQPLRIEAVPSPRQCSALDYRSSFSRAVEVQLAGQRHLYISGTASIDEGGKSVHVGDIAGQIRHTMDVVEAILTSRQMTWTNTRRAIAYFKNLRDAPCFAPLCRSCGIPDLPVTLAAATICRDDLLFEIELDAVSPM